jgi:hypothetical protein
MFTDFKRLYINFISSCYGMLAFYTRQNARMNTQELAYGANAKVLALQNFKVNKNAKMKFI